MTQLVLAQLNIAKMRYDYEAQEMQDFVANLDRINSLAEQSPGFVWRFTGDKPLEAKVFGSDILVNFSTWADVESLHHYVFNTAHVEIMRRRKEWFDRLDAHSVLWWHNNNTTPTLEQAKYRLELLKEKGATADAFTFKNRFDKSSVAQA